jgi:hypothetical protein
MQEPDTAPNQQDAISTVLGRLARPREAVLMCSPDLIYALLEL